MTVGWAKAPGALPGLTAASIQPSVKNGFAISAILAGNQAITGAAEGTGFFGRLIGLVWFPLIIAAITGATGYALSRFDENPTRLIIGAGGEVDNFHFANGFSGHGLQQGPAVGRALSELITYGAFQTLDLTALGFDRIARNEPIIEHAVI